MPESGVEVAERGGVREAGRQGPGTGTDAFPFPEETGITCRSCGLDGDGTAGPCLLVIFGASGDLTRRQLLPSLYELHRQGLLDDAFTLLGTARTEWDDESFREAMREAVLGGETDAPRAETWDDFAARLHYRPLDFTAGAEAYRTLGRRLEELRRERGLPDRVLFHLAVPPSFFPVIVGRMGEADLAASSDDGWRRLVIEKPFGEDLASARELDRALRAVFPEDRIYRIDHFLGKETVQNMLVFRFANPGFEPIWNRNYVDHVQITAAEEIGIGTRAGFYERTGVIRDMVQNHLLQLLCVTAIEPPVRCLGSSVREETVKVLRSIGRIDPVRDFVGGQYGPGKVDGRSLAGYREEEGVDPGSTTPTYCALRVTLDSWRWAGVPFYLRTGKRLPRKLTEVVVHFRPTPHTMFPGQDRHRSVLAFRLQPSEGIVQRFAAKRPGPSLAIEPVQMNFAYATAFGVEEPPRAYAWLLLDAMQGDPTLFARSDWIREAWSLVDPLVERWEEDPPAGLPNYAAGSWGPEGARRLLERDGRSWTEI